MAALFVAEVCSLAVLASRAPETLNQRGAGHSGIKTFDRVFVIVWLVLAVLTPVLAGLDAGRYHWSSLPVYCFYLGVAVLALVTAFATWAMLENEHFEQLVRIQEDREHRVVTTGPYKFVRHPGYISAIVGGTSMPLMLGSVWTFVPVVLVSILFIVRTRFEDDTLLRELRGYQDYARQTRYRLVPFVW
jgi:protein-S-isoprenylcysteine O-methyltransferase Ste14